MFRIEDFIIDNIFGERLLIHKQADQSELEENIRVARVLLNCFDDMSIRINECYVVHNSRAIVVSPNVFTTLDKDAVKQKIMDEIEKLRT